MTPVTMDNQLKEFRIQWASIKKTSLSVLRKGVNDGDVDIGVVNRAFRRKCEEWFSGNLAAGIWFNRLKKNNPEKADEFELKVKNLKLSQVPYSPPMGWWPVPVGIMIAVVVFAALYWFPISGLTAEWSIYVDVIIAIGIGILGYYSLSPLALRGVTDYNEKYLADYSDKLDAFEENLIQLLQ